MKKFFAAIVALSLGCAPVPKSSTTPTNEGVDTPKPLLVEGKTWSMTMPPAWKAVISPTSPKVVGEITVELIAQTRTNFGFAPATVVVATVDLKNLSEVTDGTFGERYHVAIVTDAENNVLRSKPIIFQGQPGRLVFYVNNKSLIGNVALVTDKNRTGYIVKCVGDSRHIISVAQACGGALKTFKLN